MRTQGCIAALAIAATLAGCGGDDGGGDFTAASPSPAPTATAGTAGCTVRERQDWAAQQLADWYLFPELLATNLSPAAYPGVQEYIDALTATARGQRRDRFFTYLTSIREEDAYYRSGASAGFGFRLSYDGAARRVFVAETLEGTPALAAGIDRGAEIVAIGTGAADLRSVADLYATGGAAAVGEALGPPDAGTTRRLRITDAAGTREVSLTKTDYALSPVSARYGVKIIEDGGRRVGYVNLRTFIETADPALREAFDRFRVAGITDIVVDLRYNGGGLLSIAELMGDLMGANRSTADVQGRTVFRPSRAERNTIRFFAPRPQSIAPTRVAFIGAGGTASASEVVINAMAPYLRANAALVGANTFGKPVGQIALDRPACDDRLRVVALATQNADRRGDYYDGLATTMEATCRAADDIAHPLGDPREASTRAALDFLAGRACTPIATDAAPRAAGGTGRRELLSPARPTTAQREVPGLF